ncbi:MAG: hypothetical protein WAK17_19225 [Candidatus Nitrosopolaris sp.]
MKTHVKSPTLKRRSTRHDLCSWIIPSNLCMTPIDEEFDTGDKTAIQQTIT